MTQPAYLELSEITKQLGNRRVLDKVSLSLEKGELLGLLGPSGSGKTTLLNIVGGFLAPEEGSVRIAGESILALAPHRRDIGITFQGYALFPHMNVSQNVAYGLRQRRVPKAEILDRVGAMLDLLGLREMERRFPRSLSGGQQQRVALARALVVRPRLMLLDEPLANLDANLRQRIRFEIRDVLRRTDVTSMFVTHDQDEAFALCDRVAVLSEGRIQQVGTAIDLIRRPNNAFVAGFIGDPNVFRARVIAAEQGRVTVDVQGFTAGAVSREPIAIGRDAEVFVRPDAIALEPCSGEDTAAAFRIVDTVHLATGQDVWVDGPLKLRVRVAPGAVPLAPATRVRLGWRAEQAHAFSAENA